MSAAIERRLEPFVPHALAALRIVSGYLFLLHGTAKLFGFPHVAMFDRLPVWSLLGVAGMRWLASIVSPASCEKPGVKAWLLKVTSRLEHPTLLQQKELL